MAVPAAKKLEPAEPREHVSWRKHTAPPRPKYTPNLTPLIDVLFVLLLFFLLIARFHQPEGLLPGSLPQTGGMGVNPTGGSVVDPLQFVVTLNPVGSHGENVSYEIERAGTAKDPKQLFEKLNAKRAAYGLDAEKVQVVIRPTGDVRWEFVVETFSQARRASFKNVALSASD